MVEGVGDREGRPYGAFTDRISWGRGFVPPEAFIGTRGAVKNPPVTASPCQPPLGKGAFGVRRCKGCGSRPLSHGGAVTAPLTQGSL